MYYSEKLSIARNGIRISHGAANKIGIFNGSKCWALWVPHFPLKAKPVHSRDLIIAPTHPVSWPYLIRLEAKVSKRRGSVESILKILEDMDFNVASMSCTPTGPGHGTLRIMAEDLDVRRKFQKRKETLDRRHPYDRTKVDEAEWQSAVDSARTLSNEEREKIMDFIRRRELAFVEARKLANEIAARMLVRAHAMQNALEDGNHEASGGGFLHRRIVERDWHLFDRKKVKRLLEDDKKLADSGAWPRVSACRAAWVTNLPYAALYGSSPEVPIALKYDARSGLLRTLDLAPLDFRPNQPTISPIPGKRADYSFAIGSFDTSENSLRVFPVSREYSRNQLLRVSVDYDVRTAPKARGGASKGIARQIAEVVREHGLAIRQVSHPMLEYGYSRESGRIDIIGAIGRGWPSKDVGGISGVERLRHSLARIGAKTRHEAGVVDGVWQVKENETWKIIHIRTVEISKVRSVKIFVSMRFDHVRIDGIEKLLHQAASNQGVELEVVRTYVESVTDRVASSIHGSHALLQLLFRRLQTAREVDRSWLDFEYGVARGKGIPVIRMLDQSASDSADLMAANAQDRDHGMLDFRLDVTDAELLKSFTEAIEMLVKHVEPDWSPLPKQKEKPDGR